MTFREPQRGESYWCEGSIREAGSGEYDDDESDDQPVILTDANEGKLLTCAIEMRDLLDQLLAASAIADDGGNIREAREVVRRFDSWEP